MSPITFICTALFLATIQASEGLSRGEKVESEDRDNNAFESFDSPVYGPGDVPKSAGLSAAPKSGYPAPVPPPLTGLPANYAAYLSALGYGAPYGYGSMYSRFGVTPYTLPYYGYGGYGSAPLNALGYGYGNGVVPGYGSSLPYINPYLARAAYGMLGYGGLPYGGLGYRFGGLRGAPVPPSVPAPVPMPAPAVPAPAFRPPAVPVQGKDGTLRPAYSPLGGPRYPAY